MTDVATIAGVAVAAAAGSIVRFRLSPYGWRATLAVNVAGSFLLGILLGAGLAIILFLLDLLVVAEPFSDQDFLGGTMALGPKSQ